MTQSKKIHFVSAITQETTTSKSEERFYYVNRKNNKVKHEGVPMRVMAGELGIIAEHLYANRHALTCNQDSEGNTGVIMIVGEFKEDENNA